MNEQRNLASQVKLKAALMALSERVQADVKAGQLSFGARAESREGTLCSVQVRKHAPILVDEPPAIGGTDAGPSPVELLLAAFAACQEISYAVFAAVGGVPLESVKVHVRGNMDARGIVGADDSIPAGFSAISYRTEIKSSADPETIRRLVATAEQRCPVMSTLARPIPIHGTVQLNGEALEG